MIIELSSPLVFCYLKMCEVAGFDFGWKASSIYQACEIRCPSCLSTPAMYEVIGRCHAINRNQGCSIRVFLHCGATWELCSQDRLPYPANYHSQQLCTHARGRVGW